MKKTILFSFFVLLMFSDCEALHPIDLDPPHFIKAINPRQGVLEIQFDESLAQIELNDQSHLILAKKSDKTVTVYFKEVSEPGKAYPFSLIVEDKSKNQLSWAGQLWGVNSSPAQIRLSEIRIAGGKKFPDAIELAVLNSGNLGGKTLEYSSDGKKVAQFIFPNVQAKKGTFLVVYYTAIESPSIIKTSKDKSFWQRSGISLSGTRGIISLSEFPAGPVEDVFIYDDQPDKSLKNYKKLWGDRGINTWKGAVMIPKGSTATRTLCRKDFSSRLPAEAKEWMIVKTGCSTLGTANKLIPYDFVKLTKKGSKAKTLRKSNSKKILQKDPVAILNGPTGL